VDAVLAAKVRPVSSRKDRHLPLLEPLTSLFPDGVLRKGSVVGVECGEASVAGAPVTGSCSPRPWVTGSRGATTLAFSLLAEVSAKGCWCAAVGSVDPGMLSLTELGIDLEHLVLVPFHRPAGTRRHAATAWPETTATLLEGMDVVLLRPPWPVRPQLARQLSARAREHETSLVVLAPQRWWPEGPDLRLEVTAAQWLGVGTGDGRLRGRLAEITVTGRRAAARVVRARLWLPAESGAIARA
jgi:hypothetical protein